MQFAMLSAKKFQRLVWLAGEEKTVKKNERAFAYKSSGTFNGVKERAGGSIFFFFKITKGV